MCNKKGKKSVREHFAAEIKMLKFDHCGTELKMLTLELRTLFQHYATEFRMLTFVHFCWGIQNVNF